MGAFIVFEGGEGVGKSTQARSLARRLSKNGYDVVQTREPGGTSLGESARRWLKTQPNLAPVTELALFISARAQLVKEVILPALDSRHVVVCDRFTGSTIAYQGYGRGLDLELIRSLNDAATGALRPDLVLLLDIPVEAGLARKPGGHRDSFESQAMEFHERVREGFLAIASKCPDRWLVLDASMKRQALVEVVWEAIQPHLVSKEGLNQ